MAAWVRRLNYKHSTREFSGGDGTILNPETGGSNKKPIHVIKFTELHTTKRPILLYVNKCQNTFKGKDYHERAIMG